MKVKFFTCGSLITLISLSFNAFANSPVKIDLDQRVKCTVHQSTDHNLEGKEVLPFTIKKLVDSPSLILAGGGSIMIYARVELYELGGTGSGYYIIATPPTELTEAHGSISFSHEPGQSSDEFYIEFSIFPTTRVYDPKTKFPTFVLMDAPKKHTLACRSLK